MRFISAPGPVKGGKFEFVALFAMSCVVSNLARLSPAVVNVAIEGGSVPHHSLDVLLVSWMVMTGGNFLVLPL